MYKNRKNTAQRQWSNEHIKCNCVSITVNSREGWHNKKIFNLQDKIGEITYLIIQKSTDWTGWTAKVLWFQFFCVDWFEVFFFCQWPMDSLHTHVESIFYPISSQFCQHSLHLFTAIPKWSRLQACHVGCVCFSSQLCCEGRASADLLEGSGWLVGFEPAVYFYSFFLWLKLLNERIHGH